jgi:hypothetical protein
MPGKALGWGHDQNVSTTLAATSGRYPYSGNALKRNQNVNTTTAAALGGTLILVMPSTQGLTYHFF